MKRLIVCLLVLSALNSLSARCWTKCPFNEWEIYDQEFATRECAQLFADRLNNGWEVYKTRGFGYGLQRSVQSLIFL